jgi:predicted DNA-binding protein (UPF0251 family)
MPRPKKCRRVCGLPRIGCFAPVNGDATESIVMTVDEYEAIRLIDYENLSQEACSIRMGIARATVQQIYERARKKIAHALVDGLSLRIEGGDYRLCDGSVRCGRAGCCRKRESI